MMDIEEYEPTCGWIMWNKTRRLRSIIGAAIIGIKVLAGAAALAAFPLCYMLAAWLDSGV